MSTKSLEISDTLEAIIFDAKRQVSTIRLMGSEVDSKEYTLDRIKELLDLKEKIQETIEFLYLLDVHRCEYGEDDYCNICGRDGRA